MFTTCLFSIKLIAFLMVWTPYSLGMKDTYRTYMSSWKIMLGSSVLATFCFQNFGSGYGGIFYMKSFDCKIYYVIYFF